MWHFVAILGRVKAVVIEITCYFLCLLLLHCNFIRSNLLSFRIVFPASTVNNNTLLHGAESRKNLPTIGIYS